MAARYEITDRHGNKRIVDGDDDIVPDGGSVRVPMMFRDSVLSAMQKSVADAAFRFDDSACRHQPGPARCSTKPRSTPPRRLMPK